MKENPKKRLLRYIKWEMDHPTDSIFITFRVTFDKTPATFRVLNTAESLERFYKKVKKLPATSRWKYKPYYPCKPKPLTRRRVPPQNKPGSYFNELGKECVYYG